MSSLVIVPERQWYLPGAGLSTRNSQTTFVYGESTGGTGYKFDRRGILTKLTVIGEVSGLTGTGTWTFTVTVYSDGVAAGNKIYELVFSSSSALGSPFSGTDTTADGGGPGVGYGTGTDIFVKATSALGGFSTGAWAYNLVLEGTHVA